jgi:hypothetical protein
MRTNYERDPEKFSGRYQEIGGVKVAWIILGWETEPEIDPKFPDDDEPEEVRTGRVVACMVGDDSLFVFEEDELVPLPRENYCSECGQIGCTHDGYDRSDTGT